MKKLLYLTILFSLCLLLLPACCNSKETKEQPKNIVFLIGDGMGIAQIYAGMVKNGNQLALEECTTVGFSKTYSSDYFTTDSGAGGTALACGVKTKNGMIGMNPDSVPVQSILHLASENGLSTGVVVACNVTHATPASFVAHQVNRNMTEEIAADFLKTNIDVFIGGGRKNFEERADGRVLTDELKEKNYTVAYTLDEVKAVKSGKLAGLLYDDHNPPMPERGDMLPEATMTAIDILDNNEKGFFLMVEASQIDWGGHANDSERVINEMLDFDKTIGLVLDYARKNQNTLVIITADHETGGMTIPNGNMETGEINAIFTTGGHSGVPVPVFAFGPGAEKFSGFQENISFKEKIGTLLGFKK